MRVCVIGNCQADGLADWVSRLVPGAEVEAFSVAGIDPDDPAVRAAWRGMLDRSELAITQIGPAHQARFGIPSPDALEAEGLRVLPAPWIMFRGFHPDCVFLFDKGVIVNGAAGAHHSGIAAAAFLEGLPETRALQLFNSFTYSALGYFDAFATASEVMSDHWRAAGLDASRWLKRPLTPFMSTINHPTVDVLEDVARQMLARAGIETVASGETPIDRLAGSGVWPIYPEIAQRLGLTGGTDFAYPDRLVSREAQVAGTYAALQAMAARGSASEAGADHPASRPVIDRARAFIRDHVKP